MTVEITGEGTASLNATRDFVATLVAATSGENVDADDLFEETFVDWSRIASFSVGVPAFSFRFVAAPVDLRVAEYDAFERDLTVEWTDVSRAEKRWRVDYSVDGGACVVADSVVGATQTTLTALVPGAEYSIRVRAENSIDASEWTYLTFDVPVSEAT